MRSLLEIGIGGATSTTGYETVLGGQSLQMWQAYYPSAEVVGIDVYPKAIRGPRIHVEQGSQADAGFLEIVASRYGPFDVVIDDGSHIGAHVATSFKTLFPHLHPGGVYVIEDLSCAYHPGYFGGPPGTPATQVTLLGDLIHDVLRQHWATNADSFPVREIHVYDEIAFLVRAEE